mmetsp:Transcript_35792/g.102332  ORF Transcript_35792/g.102332 Transcript_35792/m.102332 type:complete len:252 (+) Transcript_35792:449-1204(+)
MVGTPVERGDQVLRLLLISQVHEDIAHAHVGLEVHGHVQESVKPCKPFLVQNLEHALTCGAVWQTADHHGGVRVGPNRSLPLDAMNQRVRRVAHRLPGPRAECWSLVVERAARDEGGGTAAQRRAHAFRRPRSPGRPWCGCLVAPCGGRVDCVREGVAVEHRRCEAGGVTFVLGVGVEVGPRAEIGERRDSRALAVCTLWGGRTGSDERRARAATGQTCICEVLLLSACNMDEGVLGNHADLHTEKISDGA